MYRELISELSRGNSWVQIRPPCPEKDIENAEKAVGHRFPEELKALLREMNGDRWCLLSADEIIENVRVNRETLRPFFEEEFGMEEYLERVDRFIFFAKNGCGDYYGYRVGPNGTVEGPTVYIWEHEKIGEKCCWKEVAANLSEFITKYYNDEI